MVSIIGPTGYDVEQQLTAFLYNIHIQFHLQTRQLGLKQSKLCQASTGINSNNNNNNNAVLLHDTLPATDCTD